MSATPEAEHGEIRKGYYVPHGSSIPEVQTSFFAEEPRSTVDRQTRDRFDFVARGAILESILRVVTREKITGRSTESAREVPVFPGLKPRIFTVWESPSEPGRGAGN